MRWALSGLGKDSVEKAELFYSLQVQRIHTIGVKITRVHLEDHPDPHIFLMSKNIPVP